MAHDPVGHAAPDQPTDPAKTVTGHHHQGWLYGSLVDNSLRGAVVAQMQGVHLTGIGPLVASRRCTSTK